MTRLVCRCPSRCRGWWTAPSPTRTCGPLRTSLREQIVGLYHHAWAHSDATIDTLALDAIGHVPWWPNDRSEVTLHRIWCT